MDNFIKINVDFVKDSNLTVNELGAYIILLGYRNNKTNSCFPSIGTLSKNMKCSKNTTLKLINSLAEKGFIKKRTRFKEDGGCKKVSDSNLYEFSNMDQVFGNAKVEKVKPTNTNIVAEIIEDKPKEVFNPKEVDFEEMKENLKEQENKRQEELLKEEEENMRDENLAKIVQLYQNNVGMINALTQNFLIDVSNRFKAELFEKAIINANNRNRLNLGYLKGILNNWEDANIQTIDDVTAYELEWSRNRNTNNNKSATDTADKQVQNEQLNKLREVNKNYVSTVNLDIKDDSEIEF